MTVLAHAMARPLGARVWQSCRHGAKRPLDRDFASRTFVRYALFSFSTNIICSKSLVQLLLLHVLVFRMNRTQVAKYSNTVVQILILVREILIPLLNFI